MVTHLKFDNFVVREMAGSASSLPAILAKIAQLLSWAKSSNIFIKINKFVYITIKEIYIL